MPSLVQVAPRWYQGQIKSYGSVQTSYWVEAAGSLLLSRCLSPRRSRRLSLSVFLSCLIYKSREGLRRLRQVAEISPHKFLVGTRKRKFNPVAQQPDRSCETRRGDSGERFCGRKRKESDSEAIEVPEHQLRKKHVALDWTPACGRRQKFVNDRGPNRTPGHIKQQCR